MHTLESQLFVIILVLAVLIIIVFLYKVMLRALGGPDKKEKKRSGAKTAGQPAPEEVPARRPVVRREEDTEGGLSRG